QIEKVAGMRIYASNTSKTCTVNLKLNAQDFDVYRCEQSKLVIGLNVSNLFKLVSTVDIDDTLTLCVDGDDKTNLNMLITHGNGDVTTSNLKLMNLDDDSPTMSPI